MQQLGISAVLMRGGASKGLIFDLEHCVDLAFEQRPRRVLSAQIQQLGRAAGIPMDLGPGNYVLLKRSKTKARLPSKRLKWLRKLPGATLRFVTIFPRRVRAFGLPSYSAVASRRGRIMKALKATLLLVAVLLAATASASVFAQRGHHHRHARIGVFIGAPLLFAPWYYPAPYYYYPPSYYYPPGAAVPSSPPAYIEQGQAAAPSVQQSQSYWYYCAESKTYYPYVDSCAGPWVRVVPQAPPPS